MFFEEYYEQPLSVTNCQGGNMYYCRTTGGTGRGIGYSAGPGYVKP